MNRRTILSRRLWCAVTLLVATSLVVLSAHAETQPPPPLDRGFQLLYNLNFDAAQREFATFQHAAPDNPMGPVAEAAAYLFSELSRLNVLEARFFTDDASFRSRNSLAPDPVLRQRFFAALDRAETLARRRLGAIPKDRDALFALTLTDGLRADYASLIEDRNYAALKLARDATVSAQQLLAICPDCYDAYVATGINHYLVGSLSRPVRWLARLGGYSGDKGEGLAQLQLAAERGHYLAPFARILLAIAYVREKRTDDARRTLAQLQAQFPGNPLFGRELARLEKH